MDKYTRRRFVRLCLGVLLALTATPARAHEGHDNATPVPVANDPAFVVRSVANRSAEVVLKYRSTSNPTHLDIYVSDFATNAPVSGARIALRTTAPEIVSASATAISPGIYEAHLAYPKPGDYTLVLTLSGPVTGEFALTKLPLGYVPSKPASPAKAGAPSRTIAIVVGAGLVLVALALWVVRRRRTRASTRGAQTAALLLAGVLVLGRGVAQAHEGHDTPPGVVSGAAGPRYVAKESQFLLAIRTVPLQLEQLRSQLSAVGHVVPGSGAWTTVAAPQSGRFEGVGRTWAVGDQVARGQLLGYLQVIDRLPIRAPIPGLLADVEATSGQWVQAGQLLMRVLDVSRLRVEVPLFGENLARGLAARSATVHIGAVPNRYFPARVRGLAPTASIWSANETGSAAGSPSASPIPPLLLDVTNSGGLLRPGMLVEVSLEMAATQPVLAVPPTAIVYQETGPGVFVHTAPELFEFRPVALGARFVDRIGVTGDIKPGDRVVTQGAYSLVAAPLAAAAMPGGQR